MFMQIIKSTFLMRLQLLLLFPVSIAYSSIQGILDSTNTSISYTCTDGILSNRYTVSIEVYNDQPVGSDQVFNFPYIYIQTSYVVNLNHSRSIGSDADCDFLSIQRVSCASLQIGTTNDVATVGQDFKTST